MSYILNKKTLEKMFDMLDKSIKERIEYGTNLCVKPDKKDMDIILGDICTGVECSVTMPETCKFPERLVGDYHTHLVPKGHELRKEAGRETPSLHDLNASLIKGSTEVICIGSERTKRISCYARKRSIPHPEFLKKITADIDNGLTVDDMLDKYFIKQIIFE